MKEYAALGLLAWYQNMIPVLLPFMILTNFIIKLNLETIILKPLYPVLGTIYNTRREVLFTICMGILCGFPMGSKILSELYQQKKITRQEAEYLLAFTNNIGPAYYIGFVFPVFFKGYSLFFLLLIQYGIPLLYGIFLRFTLYRDKLMAYSFKAQPINMAAHNHNIKEIVYALDDAINSGLVQIAALGGYMIVFNVLVYFPNLLFRNNPTVRLYSHMLIEITGGLQQLAALSQNGTQPVTNLLLCVQSMLCLNGACCLFQTMKFLRGTDLSIKKYMLHKGLLCSITIVFILTVQGIFR